MNGDYIIHPKRPGKRRDQTGKVGDIQKCFFFLINKINAFILLF
jgi:hypothetical protein